MRPGKQDGSILELVAASWGGLPVLLAVTELRQQAHSSMLVQVCHSTASRSFPGSAQRLSATKAVQPNAQPGSQSTDMHLPHPQALLLPGGIRGHLWGRLEARLRPVC